MLKKIIKCFLWIFIILLFIFYKWIIAVVTTPIRCAMLGDDGVKIHLTVDEWRKLRKSVNAHPVKSIYGNDEWVFYGELSYEDEIKYEKEILFDDKEYDLFSVNKSNGIAYYLSSNADKEDIFLEDGGAYYDPKIKKMILSSKDIVGRYPSYNLIYYGYNLIYCTSSENDNLSKINELIKNYKE